MFILQLVGDNPYGSWCYAVTLWSETPGKRSELFSAPKTRPRLKTNHGWHKAILINKHIRLLLLAAEVVPAPSEGGNSVHIWKVQDGLFGAGGGGVGEGFGCRHCGPLTPGPPPGLDPPGERMSCHNFTRGSLFLQISLWPYATYHL